MTITTLAELDAALNSGKAQRFPLLKTANVGGQAAANSVSFWRSAGPHGTGTQPTTAVSCNNTTTGAIPYVLPAAGHSLHIGKIKSIVSSTIAYEIHDRLAHMAGLSGTVTTSQTVGLDIHTTGLGGTDNITQRKGESDFSRVQWWLDWYTTTGATGVNCTVTYTNQSGTSGRTVVIALPASVVTGRCIQIIPTTAGDYIRSIQSVQLSATTGTAGNFGVTATVQRCEFYGNVLNLNSDMGWMQTGLAVIYDSSCLFVMATALAATVTAPNGMMTLIEG